MGRIILDIVSVSNHLFPHWAGLIDRLAEESSCAFYIPDTVSGENRASLLQWCSMHRQGFSELKDLLPENEFSGGNRDDVFFCLDSTFSGNCPPTFKGKKVAAVGSGDPEIWPTQVANCREARVDIILSAVLPDEMPASTPAADLEYFCQKFRFLPPLVEPAQDKLSGKKTKLLFVYDSRETRLARETDTLESMISNRQKCQHFLPAKMLVTAVQNLGVCDVLNLGAGRNEPEVVRDRVGQCKGVVCAVQHPQGDAFIHLACQTQNIPSITVFADWASPLRYAAFGWRHPQFGWDNHFLSPSLRDILLPITQFGRDIEAGVNMPVENVSKDLSANNLYAQLLKILGTVDEGEKLKRDRAKLPYRETSGGRGGPEFKSL